MPSENDPPRNRSRDRNDRDDYDDRPRRRDRDDRDYDDDRPRRRDREDDDYDDDSPRRRGDRTSQPAGNGLAVASLILGILSFCTSCLTGVPAIICGLIAMGKPTGRGMAITGLILGGLGTIAGGVGSYFAYMKVEGAKYRMKEANNMKQIGLALHNQEMTMMRMSAPYAQDLGGQVNTDLSWRVGILPYIEQGNLYNSFDLKQPWDSPKNKSLSNTIVKTYVSPYDSPSVNTPYRVFYGGGAMFEEDGKPILLMSITDGTSNTIMMVQAWDQVPWAQPKDLKYDPKGPLPKLGHPELSGGFQVLMADGSVRFISKNVSEKTLRAAITKNGGETLGSDW